MPDKRGRETPAEERQRREIELMRRQSGLTYTLGSPFEGLIGHHLLIRASNKIESDEAKARAKAYQSFLRNEVKKQKK